MKSITFTAEISSDNTIQVPDDLNFPKGKARITIEEISDKRNNNFSTEDFLEKWSGFLQDEASCIEKSSFL